MGVIFMCGLTHSNDTTGKDRKRYGFRHFFNAYQSGVAPGPMLKEEMGTDRKAYHLTADYTWCWHQEEPLKTTHETPGSETAQAVRTQHGLRHLPQYPTPRMPPRTP